MTACTTCGAVPRPGAAFCGECGTVMPADAPAPERPGFITLPPGVTPVAATNTGPAPSPAARAAAVPPPIVPPSAAPIVPPVAAPVTPPVAPPVIPPAATPVVPPVVPPVAQPAAAEPIDVDATRMAAPRRTVTWSLVLPDGSSHLVSTTAVVGRSPDASGHGAEMAISVGAEQKSVSKSHALIESVAGGLRIRDLGSVNGVVVVRADGSEAEATTSQWVELTDGDELELGEVVIVVRRG